MHQLQCQGANQSFLLRIKQNYDICKSTGYGKSQDSIFLDSCCNTTWIKRPWWYPNIYRSPAKVPKHQSRKVSSTVNNNSKSYDWWPFTHWLLQYPFIRFQSLHRTPLHLFIYPFTFARQRFDACSFPYRIHSFCVKITQFFKSESSYIITTIKLNHAFSRMETVRGLQWLIIQSI